MAGILDRYGIKEVADVTFYDIATGAPVLYLDTLKVSTIEQTAESADARGGKGNPKLITWDYGKEINVTLEDALFSPKSMAIMFGNGTVTGQTAIERSINYTATATTKPTTVYSMDGRSFEVFAAAPTAAKASASVTWYTETGESAPTSLVVGKTYIGKFSPTITNGNQITITNDDFPGTYKVVGDTYARSEKDGKDHAFQFVIEKAKVTAENTITLEAEGDPSVFNLNLTVLRPESGEMMKLIQYDLSTTT